MKEGTIAPIPVTTGPPTIFTGRTVIAQHKVLNKWINKWMELLQNTGPWDNEDLNGNSSSNRFDRERYSNIES